MQIIEYNYRKPKWLEPLDPIKIDTLVIHHTGNNNNIKINTDYHIDSNAWNWLGYAYYITNEMIYKIRGIEYKDAGVRGHNHHTCNIAVQGNYNNTNVSKGDMKALEWLIKHLKKSNSNIKYIKGHNEFNETTCPGKNIDVKLIEVNTKEETINFDKLKIKELQQDNEFLIRNNIELISEIERLDRMIRKDREKYDELKEMYKKNLQELRAKT